MLSPAKKIKTVFCWNSTRQSFSRPAEDSPATSDKFFSAMKTGNSAACRLISSMFLKPKDGFCTGFRQKAYQILSLHRFQLTAAMLLQRTHCLMYKNMKSPCKPYTLLLRPAALFCKSSIGSIVLTTCSGTAVNIFFQAYFTANLAVSTAVSIWETIP